MIGEKDYEVFAALHEEANLPWVWLLSHDFGSRDIVRIGRSKPRKSIYCQARLIDENFRNYYNIVPRRKVENQNALVISDWYREKLGALETGKTYPLTIRRYGWPRGPLLLYWHHPDRVVRMAFCLSVISVVLGCLSLVVAVSPRIRNFSSNRILSPDELGKLQANCLLSSFTLNVPSASLTCSVYNGSSYAIQELTIEVPVAGAKKLFRVTGLEVGTYETGTFSVNTGEPIYSDMARSLVANPRLKNFSSLPSNEKWSIVERLGNRITNPKSLEVSVRIARARGRQVP